MIENPAMPVQEGPDYGDEVPSGTSRARIAVRKRPAVDYDAEFDRLIQTIETTVCGIDAKLLREDRHGRREMLRIRSVRELLALPEVQKRVKDRISGRDLKDLNQRIMESDFRMGLYPDEQPYSGTTSTNVFQISDVALPSLTSPYAKNQTLVDYLESHRRAWEASVRNPLGKRIVNLIPQFVLGRGVKGSHPEAEYQEAWDSFWRLNRMNLRIKQILRELLIYGEVFLRYFTTREGLQVRSIDPMTIWDIVTDPDDLENVKYYHQQYVVTNLNTVTVPNPQNKLTPSTLVIRQIPPEEIDHYKINATSSEKRGRSELYAVLGWLLRLKEFANDRVMINKMRSMFALDVMVDGDESDLSDAESKFATPPGPGSVLVHNKAIEVEFKNTNSDASEARTDLEMILKIISIGVGISEQFLGVSNQTNRAAALISAEPDVKAFEEKRELVEDMLMKAFDRVRAVKRLAEPDTPMEFTFPSLAAEDRSTKLKDLGYAEAMDWISKKRSATMAAREFEITTYDYEREREVIKKERGGKPLIMQGQQQVPKVQPEPPKPMAGEGPLEQGQKQPFGGPAKPGLQTQPKPGVTSMAGQMGFPDGRGQGGRALPNTKATLNRSNFTRGGEKTRVAKNRTSGTPLRHAAEPDSPPRRGWTDRARQISLQVRQERARQRREQIVLESAHGTGVVRGDSPADGVVRGSGNDPEPTDR